MRSDRERILDILEAIDRIRDRARTKKAFTEDELIQVWVVHHLEIIGEAAGNVSEDLRRNHPEVPWTLMAAQRNQLVHAYFRIDSEEVWRTMDRELPRLKEDLKPILARLPR